MPTRISPSTAGILFIMAGMAAISVNDMMIKQLSGGYPLHEIVFARSFIGLLFSLIIVQIEGGFSILKTRQPGLHAIRGMLVVISNMTFFLALATLPLADATALFFVAPLFITVLSIPLLGEKVGPLRIGAVVIGFVGVLLMQRPWASAETLGASRVILFLPVVAALAYAGLQLLTRKLGTTTKASALAVYIQGVFILVSVAFFLVAGDGRYAAQVDDPSLQFLLRAWVWPQLGDWVFLLGLGANSAIIGYCLSAAYKWADAATVAPFEYVLLPMAVFWGWLFWGELPEPVVWVGMALIIFSGLFVFLRERQKARADARASATG